MSSPPERRKILTLPGDMLRDEGILAFLSEHFEIHPVGDLKAAVDALRETHYDAVLSETSNFLPLERAAASQQAAAVLDTLGEGVCIVDGQGELVWANRRLRQFLPEVLQQVRDVCAQAYESLAMSTFPEHGRTRRFSIMPEDGSYYEVICSPIYDSQPCLRQVAAVVVDATAQRRQQLTINAIERAGHELVRLDTQFLQSDDTAGRLGLLEDRIISSARDVLHFEHVAVLLLNEKTNRLEWLAHFGLDDDVEHIEVFSSAEGNGICGYVAASGHSYLCPDVEDDPHYICALAGARSSLTVPLRLHDRVIGVLNVESHHAGAFGEMERQFAEVFAHYVAMALYVLDLRNAERRNASAEIRDSLHSQLQGPLSEVVTRATNLMDEHIGHDDLRLRLQELIDAAGRARLAVPAPAETPKLRVLSPSEPQAPLEDSPLAGRRILVVDDEDMIRKVLRGALVSAGCKIEVCGEGGQAIAKARDGGFDCVITDIRLPGADGYAVFAAASCPVVLMTAFAYDPNHPAIVDSGRTPASILYKPFNVSDLLPLLGRILRSKA